MNTLYICTTNYYLCNIAYITENTAFVVNIMRVTCKNSGLVVHVLQSSLVSQAMMVFYVNVTAHLQHRGRERDRGLPVARLLLAKPLSSTQG